MERVPPAVLGQRFQHLVNLGEQPTVKGVRWNLVRCDCGVEKSVRFANLRNGSIRSCGCQHSSGVVKKRITIPIGARTNFWTFIGGEHSRKATWVGSFRCDCGSVQVLSLGYVLRGISKSCGCKTVAGLKHGLHGIPEYELWKRIKSRCFNKHHADYPDYGGRGIGVHPPWVSDFLAFYKYLQRYLGEKPDGYSLDRRNNNRGYVPGNIRWATDEQQANNRRNSHHLLYQGVHMTITQLSKLSGVSYDTLHHRITTQGWSPEKAATTPTRRTT